MLHMSVIVVCGDECYALTNQGVELAWTFEFAFVTAAVLVKHKSAQPTPLKRAEVKGLRRCWLEGLPPPLSNQKTSPILTGSKC